jgi:hypothetical protein
MSKDSPSGTTGDNNSSDRILQSLQQDAGHCMAILMSTSQDHTGVGSEHHLKSSLIKPEDAREALHRMRGLLEEALMLEDVHHQLEQWFASITANVFSLSWTASLIPDLLTLLEILDQHDCAKHHSQEVAVSVLTRFFLRSLLLHNVHYLQNRVKTLSHSMGEENQNHIASILCSIMDILSSVKNLEE